jgi:hypothetical protein
MKFRKFKNFSTFFYFFRFFLSSSMPARFFPSRKVRFNSLKIALAAAPIAPALGIGNIEPAAIVKSARP